ncbi:MAG: hypothetical protein EYC70_00650 [Planctomycetota bacterium]|nr:MAG: hypothetical protein EYC70_00650 [Planctomycetota bacterium]
MKLRLVLAGGAAALATLGATCGGDGDFEPAPFNPHPPVFNPNLSRPTAQQLQVQMAYNLADGRIYGHVIWPANRGHLSAFYLFQDGAWSLQGEARRELLETGAVASAESRLSLMWGDAAAAASTPNFQQLGCALACHDDGHHMPGWVEDGSDEHQSMHLPPAPFYEDTSLDLWAWRAHTAAPIGYWSDEILDDTQPVHDGHQHGEAAMHPDEGSGGFEENLLLGGNPVLVYDAATTVNGSYAVPMAQLASTPDYFFTDPANPGGVTGFSGPLAMSYADAAAQGYTPVEGDTVPFWVLSQPQGSRGDILAVISPDGGVTVAEQSFYDAAAGVWHSYFTRSMTGSPGDLRFVRNRQYVVAFAVHRDLTEGRDHYMSFPQVVWIEDPRNPGGFAGSDFTAVQLTVPGEVPDFSDTTAYPPFTVDMVLPGVLSFEFLTDTREADYIFGQTHGGYDDLLPAVTGPVGIGCRACHTLRDDDPFTPFLEGGSLEFKTARRGGLFEATPISLEFNVRPVLDSRCLPCHAPGGSAAAIPFSGVPSDQVYGSLIAPGRVTWPRPARSPLLRVPAADQDGNHPPEPPLDGFDGSPDYQRMLYWILYNAPNN